MIQAEFEINEFDHSEEKVKLKETGSSWRSTSKGEGETDINCIKNKQTNKQTNKTFVHHYEKNSRTMVDQVLEQIIQGGFTSAKLEGHEHLT